MKRPDLGRQLGTSSSDADSAFEKGSASSAAPPGFGSSDVEDGLHWDNPNERAAAVAERLKQVAADTGESKSLSLAPTPAPFASEGGSFYGATRAQVERGAKKYAPKWSLTLTRRMRRTGHGRRSQAGSTTRGRE
jgi:hypothetical protein